jgi:L-ascorbate metabolism protein UlaG (beta-lactamase superfamily)
MKSKIILCILILAIFSSCKNIAKKNASIENVVDTYKKTLASKAEIIPISHATAVIKFENTVMYLDPTGGLKAFSNFKNANFVIITDIHGDHMNIKTLKALNLKNTTLIAPKAVAKKITTLDVKEIITLNNGEAKKFSNFKIEAIPMYNLRKEALKFHPKGRGNGYVFTINNERIYFSGDTEDIPEMRNLKNIDKAFVCMNLPYTMTVEKAADAVLEFKPTEIYPYHYKGTDGLSAVKKFKEIVTNQDINIKVIQWDWYLNND